jgi:Ca-activated chloride channel family protein
MLRFDNIDYLYILSVLPLVIIGMLIYARWRKESLLKFGDNILISELTKSSSKIRRKTKNLFTVFILLFLIIGISNPQIGTKMEEVKREGVDLMIAIDLSYSMMAEDIKPNRLERSKQAISRLIDQLKGDRIGLVVFAGQAYVQLPITTDYSAAKLFLSTVKPNLIPTQGTKIGNAIDLCINSFEEDNNQSKAIIIITDGETHDEQAIEMAKKAQEQGIITHTLGMGLKKGGPIPIYNKNGNTTEYRKDREGNTIVTKLNEKMLQKIAQAGSGTYIRANNSKAGLNTLFTEINKMEKKDIGTMIFTQYKDRFQIFLLLSLFFIFLDFIFLERKNKWNKNINLYK